MSSDLQLLDEEWKANGLKLFDYQETGVTTMQKWQEEGHGGINADEMGLGKTCQAVTTIVRLFFEGQGPFLVLAPLSVCSHWASEVTRFSCGHLSPIEYVGHEAQRADVRNRMNFARNSVFITAYHIFRSEETQEVIAGLEQRNPFSVIVVDEAQVIKNLHSQITNSLARCKGSATFLLLTGTPIQNNLSELYTLLTFINPCEFPDEGIDRFQSKYRKPENVDGLKTILKKYMLRRTKAEVFSTEMAECQQVLLYHGISTLQKEIYRGIVAKNAEAFKKANTDVSLVNILMQLRKCAIHPYMFTGVEPEPFIEGEHLVDASGKLQVLDRLLRYAKDRGHRCLVFSQFLGSLDIVEDFLRLRGWKYERLDGTSRAEERQEKVSAFQKSKGYRKGDPDDGPLCFLLTTKAGGVGLNLTAADTVIFLDSDWNPQNDIQAMARCHRIGQTKPVRVIRLVARYTVDQYVVAKARDKLKLTDQILGNQESKIQAADVIEVLKTNFGRLMDTDSRRFACTDKELEDIIGRSDENGEWMSLDGASGVSLFMDPDECDENDVDKEDYSKFEGVSARSEDPSTEEWDDLMKEVEDEEKKGNLGKRKRERTAVDDIELSPPRKKTARKPVDKEAFWAKKGYTSLNIALPPDEWEVDDNVDETALKYVFGDVTKPRRTGANAIILCCVDNGGSFGYGAYFKAIRALDDSIPEVYEKAGEMRDLHLGDAHLVTVGQSSPSTSSAASSNLHVALLVAQSSKRRDVMKAEVLDKCLRRVSRYAVENNCVIHTPRMGKFTDIGWYTVDRMLKKHFSLRGVRCLVYYHPPARRDPDEEEEEVEEEVETKPPPPKRIPMAELPIPRDEIDLVSFDDELKLERLTPDEEEKKERETPSGRSRRTEANNYKAESGKKEAEDSSDDDGASGSDWEEEGEKEEEDEEEYESDGVEEEEEEDEKVEEKENLKETRKRKKPVEKKKPVAPKTPPRKFLKYVDSSSDEDDAPPARLFQEADYSVFGLDPETLTKCRHLMQHRGGFFVHREDDLKRAVYAIVPKDLVDKTDELDEYKAKFDADCIFLRSEFIAHAVKMNSMDDLAKFVV